jgi:hypothetical protein
MAGYVYLIGNARFHWFKIGKSKTPEVRIENIGVLLPFKIKVFGIWKAQNHTLMESALHEQHAQCRINGEWFSFSDKKIREIYFSIPGEACIYWHHRENMQESKFSKFSNMTHDVLSTKPKSIKMEVVEITPRT